MTWGRSSGEKALEEGNTEEGRAELREADADVGLDMNSGDKNINLLCSYFSLVQGTALMQLTLFLRLRVIAKA